MKKKIISMFLMVVVFTLMFILSGCKGETEKQNVTNSNEDTNRSSSNVVESNSNEKEASNSEKEEQAEQKKSENKTEEKTEKEDNNDNKKLSEEEMYKSVLDEYKKVLSEYDNGNEEIVDKIESEYKMVNFPVILLAVHFKDEGNKIAYTFYDIDGNGIKELIVGISADSNKTISEGAIYTYNQSKKQPVKVFYQSTMERGTLSVYDSGIIYSQGSGGASLHYYSFGKLSNDGNSYNSIEEIEEEYIESGKDPIYRDYQNNKELNYKNLDEILNKYVSNSKRVKYSDIRGM